MKTASVQGSSLSSPSRGAEAAFGGESHFFSLPTGLAQLWRSLADSLPAIGLAEGGDTEGAAELLERSGVKKP